MEEAKYLDIVEKKPSVKWTYKSPVVTVTQPIQMRQRPVHETRTRYLVIGASLALLFMTALMTVLTYTHVIHVKREGIYGGEEQSDRRITKRQSSNPCVSDCTSVVDGDYQSCNGCDVFVTCSNGQTFDDRPCPGGLVWDDSMKRCEFTSTTCFPNGFGLNNTCLQTNVCLDPNTECDLVSCVCPENYFENNGSCELLKYAGENCTSDIECKGDNIECSGSPQTCRCPPDRYFDFTRGSCEQKKILEESCEPGQCEIDNSVCDSLSSTCGCQEGYFDDNGAMIGGNCSEKIGLNETCTQTDACSDPNAECLALMCSCEEGFFDAGEFCEPLKHIGENCSETAECRGDNTECSGSPSTCRCPSDRYLDFSTGNCLTELVLGDSCEAGQCGTTLSYCDPISMACACPDGYYDDNGATSGGSCSPKISLGAACSRTDACFDVNAVCSTTCTCDTDYYNNAGTCELLLCIGEMCAATGDCRGSNVECSGSPATCRCPSDRYHDETTGDCLTKLVLGESCVAGQCGTINSFCDSISNTCECAAGYFDDNGATSGGSCTAKLGLGIACSQTDACSDVNAACSTTCSCDTDYYNNAGTCEPLVCIGETCSATSNCRGSNVECSGSPTTCRCPSDRYLDITSGDCLAKLVLGDSCVAGQCGTTNSVCDPISNTCACATGYYDDNGATSGGSCSVKLALGAACSQTDACADVKSVCSTTCTCITDYYNNDGTCEPLLYIGERCSTAANCKGSNVECSGSPTTCRCPSNRFLDVTSGDCLLRSAAIGEACVAGQCTANNAVCDSGTSTCQCPDGYQYDGATCLLCPSLDWEVFNGSCYLFSTEELRYNPARTLCDRFDTSTENSNLVQVDTSAELFYLKNFMSNRVFQPTSGYWNDLYEVTTNGNEVWRTSGDPLTVSDWTPGQPREDNNTVQKCTIFYGPFLYRQMDTTCDGRLAAPLCEITPA